MARPTLHLTWMATETRRLLDSIGDLSDDDLLKPSLLPDWTRGHVLAHIGLNAPALGNLAAWADDGAERSMYPSRAARDSDIEAASTWGIDRLATFVADQSAALAATLEGLDDDAWNASLQMPSGASITGAILPWFRTREVAVHTVDMAIGITFEGLPEELCTELVSEVVAMRSSRPDCPSAQLRAISTDASWQLGANASAGEVTGTTAQLAAWLTGRADGADLSASPELPDIGPWA